MEWRLGIGRLCARNDRKRRNLAVAHVPARVPSPSDLQTFATVRCKPRFAESATYASASRLSASSIEAGGHEGGQGFAEVLEVLGETPVCARPPSGAAERRSSSFRRSP